MKFFLLAAAFWIGTGQSAARAVHALAHEHRIHHSHHHDEDGDHNEHETDEQKPFAVLKPAPPEAALRNHGFSPLAREFRTMNYAFIPSLTGSRLDTSPPRRPSDQNAAVSTGLSPPASITL